MTLGEIGIVKKQISWLIVLPIIFMHFMVASPLDYPLTITPFVLAYFIYKHYKLSIRPSSLLIAIVLLILPVINLIRYELFNEIDYAHFFRTYALWVFALLATLIGTTSRIRNQSDYSKEFIVSGGMIIFFSTAQVIVARVFNSTALYFPFGSFTYMGTQDESRFVGEGFVRAPAFYLEPSFCAFILFFILVAILIKENRPRRIVQYLLIGIGSMLVVGSASGAFLAAVLAVLILPGLVKKRAVRLVAFVSVFVFIVAGTLLLLPQRLAEIGIEGTSGYWRLVAPLIILSNVFGESPFGIPFGQVERYVEPLGLQHAQNIGTSIDNSMYLLMFLFGWLAVIFLIGLVSKLFVAYMHNERRSIALWWYVIASLQYSGGVMTPEYIFPLLLVVYTYRVESMRQQIMAGCVK